MCLCFFAFTDTASAMSGLRSLFLLLSACASDGNSRLKMRKRDTSCPLLDIVALAPGIQSC